MNGWIVALVLLVLLLVVAVMWWRMRAQLQESLAQLEGMRQSLHQAQEQVEQQHADAVLGRALRDVAKRLQRQDKSSAQPNEKLIEALVGYHKRVHAYDGAVQYCLQPVELMPGAEDDDLDKLVDHVSGARKRLLAARAALVEHDILQHMQDLVDSPAQPDDADVLVAQISTLVSAGQNHQAVELAEVLDAGIEVTRMRYPAGPKLDVQLSDLPVLPQWPWFAPTLLHLLDLGMRGSDADQAAQFSVRFEDGRVHMKFLGGHQHAADSDARLTIEAGLRDVRNRMDERGVELVVGSEDARKLGFDLIIPVEVKAVGETI